LVANSAMTDSGNHKKFTHSGGKYWSRRSGYTPVIRPNGILTGGVVTVDAGGANDAVDIAALTCYLAGVETTVGAGGLSASRSVLATHRITSITVTSAGALAAVAATDDAGAAAFSETRGAVGGPPFIPVGSIELAQVRLSAAAAAPVTEAEIFQVVGTHRELSDYPLWNEYAIGDETTDEGYVEFLASLPLSHTGSVTKAVYVQYYDPQFAEVSIAGDFVPPYESQSVSSTQYYNKTVAATSTSLNQGSFVALLQDGITDALRTLDGEMLCFRFYADRNKSAHMICQGTLSSPPSFPAADNISANCTISAEQKAFNRAA
jgi:hypothetical protein